MVLTEEKAKVISEFLMADKERGQRLLTLSPEEATKEMNAAGCDISVDELVEFGGAMAQSAGNEAAGKEELSDADLDSVAGGLGPVAAYAIACGIALACGYGVGRLEKW